MGLHKTYHILYCCQTIRLTLSNNEINTILVDKTTEFLAMLAHKGLLACHDLTLSCKDDLKMSSTSLEIKSWIAPTLTIVDKLWLLMDNRKSNSLFEVSFRPELNWFDSIYENPPKIINSIWDVWVCKSNWPCDLSIWVLFSLNINGSIVCATKLLIWHQVSHKYCVIC